MGTWIPPASVGDNELIGRRLFDEPLLAGVGNQPRFSGINLNNFFEKRDDQFSVDRLGASGADKKVVRYLEGRCDAAGTRFQPSLPFDGWFTIRARELTKERQGHTLPLIASPQTEAHPNDNPFHAHVVLPNELSYYLSAFHLRHVFTTYGGPLRRRSAQQGGFWFALWRAVITGCRAARDQWRQGL